MFRRLLCKRRGTLCVHRPGLTLKVPIWRGKNYITRTLKNQDLILYFHNLYTIFPILVVMYFVWIIRNEFDLCSSIWYNRTECQKRKSICELFLTRKRAFGENQNWLLILGLNFVIIEVKFILVCRNCEDWNSLLTLVPALIRIEVNLFFLFTLANIVSWGLLFLHPLPSPATGFLACGGLACGPSYVHSLFQFNHLLLTLIYYNFWTCVMWESTIYTIRTQCYDSIN